ncbi:PIN domain protein [Rickettsia endosymbiont of Ixodes scapularis]|nr:PIN domain protein [Rickettsia endosymbiont of Ixodes scapularis]
MLENKGKIAFSIELNDWIDKLLFIRGLNLIDLSVSILIQSCLYLIMNIKTRKIMYTNYNIRFIIAATRFDQKIIEYANLGYLKIIQAK